MKTGVLGLILLSLAGSLQVKSQSAWLPEPRKGTLSPGFTFSTFDEFWVGKNRNPVLRQNDERMDQYLVSLSGEYGVSRRWAVDWTLGYTWTSSPDTFGGKSDEGMADSLFGVRYQLHPETRIWPALALRLGGIIAGGYEENTPFSAGDGAHGLEMSLQAGKAFGDTGYGVFGEGGYRLRETPAPDEVFASVGIFRVFPGIFDELDDLTIAAGYRYVESLSGLDIMGPGFQPALGPGHGFPALKEMNQLAEIRLAYRGVSGIQYQAGFGKTLVGRNTGDRWISFLSVSVPLGCCQP